MYVPIFFQEPIYECSLTLWNVQVYDLRKGSQSSSLVGHTDTPTSLCVSPNGNYLLSPSFSSQTIIWDIRPFSPSPNRVHRVLQGAPAGFENTLLKGAWSRDDGGKRAALGGADRMVCIWDADGGKILYKVVAFISSFLCCVLSCALYFNSSLGIKERLHL